MYKGSVHVYFQVHTDKLKLSCFGWFVLFSPLLCIAKSIWARKPSIYTMLITINSTLWPKKQNPDHQESHPCPTTYNGFNHLLQEKFTCRGPILTIEVFIIMWFS